MTRSLLFLLFFINSTFLFPDSSDLSVPDIKDYYSGVISGLKLGNEDFSFEIILNIKEIKEQINNFDSPYKDKFIRLAKYVKAVYEELDTMVYLFSVEPYKIRLEKASDQYYKVIYKNNGYEHSYYIDRYPMNKNGGVSKSFIHEQLNFFKELYGVLNSIYPIDSKSLLKIISSSSFLFNENLDPSKIAEIRRFSPDYTPKPKSISIDSFRTLDKTCSEAEAVDLLNGYLPESRRSNNIDVCLHNFIEYIGEEKDGVLGKEESVLLYGRQDNLTRTFGLFDYLVMDGSSEDYKTLAELFAWISYHNSLCNDRDVSNIVIGYLKARGYLTFAPRSGVSSFFSIDYKMSHFESSYGIRLPSSMRNQILNGVYKYSAFVK